MKATAKFAASCVRRLLRASSPAIALWAVAAGPALGLELGDAAGGGLPPAPPRLLADLDAGALRGPGAVADAAAPAGDDAPLLDPDHYALLDPADLEALGPDSPAYRLLRKVQDRVYLAPVVATGYRVTDLLGEGQEQQGGTLVTLAALHYAVKPWLSAFAVYGVEAATPRDLAQVGGLGVAYTDYLGLTLAVCVDLGEGWGAAKYRKNYLVAVGLVVHGLDLDLSDLLTEEDVAP